MTVSRDDLERKAQELVGAVDQTRESARNTAIIGALVVAGVVAAAFIFGRRRGSRNKTVVEVYKV
ncbi:MAG TPA: hypothetical protein VFS66_00975 [Acidimicrobiia bacterium]|nr:hypothetical protein [Acidimicrobiia bacterium]